MRTESCPTFERVLKAYIIVRVQRNTRWREQEQQVLRPDRSSAIFPGILGNTTFHKAAAIHLYRGARMCITKFQNGAKIRNENA